MAPLASMECTPDVFCGIIITDSRLDDELSVATIDFSDTPQWLRDLNLDPRGFPKSTMYGTLWRGVDRSATDTHGRTAFINAVINGNTGAGMLYVEMLAEFSDTDVNVQDSQGRTALHWACINNLPDMVGLCLSISDLTVGLKDNEGLTAFDAALQTGDEVIPTLFYESMFQLEESEPDVALLRALTITSEPPTDTALFPGEAIFNPILLRKGPLVKALVDRGIDLTTTNDDGQTALHLATGVGDVSVMETLLEAGSDANAVGMAGATPLHCAAQTGQLDAAQLLLNYGAHVGAKDRGGKTALEYAVEYGADNIVALLKAEKVEREEGKQIPWMAPFDEVHPRNQDNQPALPTKTGNIVHKRPAPNFESVLAMSCQQLVTKEEGISEVDRELVGLISFTFYQINASSTIVWHDVILAMEKNPNLVRVGDTVIKTRSLYIRPSGGNEVFCPYSCSISGNQANRVFDQVEHSVDTFVGNADIVSNLHLYDLSLGDPRFKRDTSLNLLDPSTDVGWTKSGGHRSTYTIISLLRYPIGAKPYFMVCGTVARAGLSTLAYTFRDSYSGSS